MCFRKMLIVVFVFLLMGVSESYAGKVINCSKYSSSNYSNSYPNIVRNYSNKKMCEEVSKYQNFPSMKTLCKDGFFNAINDELSFRRLDCNFDMALPSVDTKNTKETKQNKSIKSKLYKGLFNNEDICDKASTLEGTWANHSDLFEFVEEAKRRGLDCAVNDSKAIILEF